MNSEYTPGICLLVWVGVSVLFVSVIGFLIASGLVDLVKFIWGIL